MSKAPVTVTVSSPDLAKAQADLRRGARALPGKLREGVRRAAEESAKGVRDRAAFSSRIPGAVRVTTSGMTASVTVDPAAAPEAAALNNRGQGGEFEHPVYGMEDVIVSQTAQPFFETGVADKRSAADDQVDLVLDSLDKIMGF